MNTKHQPATPLPWKEHAGFDIGSVDLNGDGDYSATAYGKGDAAFIVHAANKYPLLVNALRQMSEKLLSLSNGSAFDLSDSPKSYRSNVELFANDAASFLKDIGEA